MQATCGRASAPHSPYHPYPKSYPYHLHSHPTNQCQNPTPTPPQPHSYSTYSGLEACAPALPSVPRAGMTSAREGLRRHCGSSCSLCRSSRLQCERCATRCYWRARSHSLVYEDASRSTRGGAGGSYLL